MDICEMQDLISSYLIQTKECNLPAIGKISLVTSSNEVDIANKKIMPAEEKVVFSSREDRHIAGIVKYISEKENIDENEAGEKFKMWCQQAKERIGAGEKIVLNSLGFFEKNIAGTISFKNERTSLFFESVRAERVIHKNEEHAVLVGDRETTSSVMNQFLNEEEIVDDSRWKIAAIVFLAIAVIVLFIHFYLHSFSFFSTGNENQFSPATPAATYSQQ